MNRSLMRLLEQWQEGACVNGLSLVLDVIAVSRTTGGFSRVTLMDVNVSTKTYMLCVYVFVYVITFLCSKLCDMSITM